MTDFDLEQQLLQNRYKQYAGQQYEAPRGQMIGDIYVGANPLQHVAAALRGYGSIKGMNQTEQQMKDLQGQRKQAIADALRGFQTEAAGAPAYQAAGPAPEGQDQSGGYQVAAQPGNMRNAYTALLNAPDASLRSAGLSGLAQMPQLEAAKEERLAARDFRREEAEANRQARMEQLKMQHDARMQMMQEQNATRQQMAQAQRDFQVQMAQMNAANRPERQAQIIQTDNGPMQLVNGQAMPIMGPTGQPISGVKTPEAQQRLNDANAALATIQQAEKIIPKSTSSYAGAGVDQAARLIGMSTPGAQAAAQLKALEGDLVSKMPKMSGPQSDKDVQLYRQMAGQIGDPTIPVATKQAALQTIKEIQARYAGPQANKPPMNPQDAAALQWANANPGDPRAAAIRQRLGQ
jgi:hypothetical protein